MGAEGESGAGKAAGGSFFTETQWEELERQKMIHKYLLASVPVPPQLLCYGTASSLPFPKTQAAAATTTTLIHASQSNTSLISGLDMRYSTLSSSSSGGSMDAEPWRCKRTDGKKWRCSRDVAPDLKYCERHAHKTRGPRSRKPVEQHHHHQSHNSNITTTHSQQHHLKTGTTTPQQHLQRPTSQFQTLPTPTSYDQTRTMEWFMRGGSSSVTTCNQQQQWQQLMQTSSSSSGLGLNRDNTDDNNKNVPHSYQYEVDKQGFMGFFNPYISVGHQKMDNSPILDPKFASLQSGPSLNADDKIQTTRHFIDAWGKESLAPESLSKRFSPSSSLSLSMNGINEDNNYDNGYLGIGMMDSDRDSSNDGIMKPQWLNNPVSYGGPLGEALCLGNASTTRGGGLNSSLASPAHGYSINSNNTNSSGCSKSSCEDGSHALNFIG